ncbi:MAG: hypothetical protein JXB15_00660 [Anaerolineales bacterium]|nr:hypothetical protein [Anaerolineales bacterium]
MKKLLCVLVLFSVLLSASTTVDLVRLTLVNKSDMPIAVELAGIYQETYFYLDVAQGSRIAPVEREFTIPRDAYTLRLYYLETYDPVYGFKCSATATSLEIMSNTRIIFLPCGEQPPNPGERTLLKFWPFRIKFRY